ncbi:MAG: glycosyltransferase family 4 protein [Acidimicrobiia bacterium]
MKIAVIGPLELPKAQGGVTRHCEEIYARVASDGHDVTVLCAGGPSPDVTHRGMKIRHLRTASGSGWERLTYALAASWAATRGNYDVVHYHSFASSAFCFLPKLRRRRIVTTAHRIEWQDAKWGRVTRWFLRYCEWIALRCSDALIAVSQALQDDLFTRDERAAKIVVISNGVTRPDPVDPAALDALGLRPRAYLLVVGRLVPEKGVDVAIAAYLDLLRGGDIDVDLAIVGGSRKAGSTTEVALARQAEPAGERVHFLGVQEPDVVAMLYDNAAALLAPSYQEGQPLVVAEAMRAGCCIVASDIAAHLELVGDTARIFAAGDADALGRAIRWVLDHRDEARTLGERGAARIAAGSYSWDEAAVATERVLSSTG